MIVLRSGLPTEFLSTPFGQSMKPQIDAMFRRTTSAEHPINAPGNYLPTPPESGTSTPANPLAAGLLSAVAQQATTTTSTPPTAPTSPLTLVSSSTNFDSLLTSHSALIVNFTNTPTCAPCRAIKPAYESIAANYSDMYGAKGARFLEVELGIGEGQQIASRYSVTATPTFMFFKDGKKAGEMKGAAKRELEVRVEEFLEECYPRHPHRKVYLPAVESISTNPILAANVPAYPALLGKLESFGVQVEWLKEKIVPVLEGKAIPGDAELDSRVREWVKVSEDYLKRLKPGETFPVIDLWRVGLLNPRISSLLALHLSPTGQLLDPISPILDLATSTLKAQSTSTPKPFLLTTLRFMTNLLASLPLANLILSTPPSVRTGNMQSLIIEIVVDSLLHPDGSVRSAAAGVAVNLGGWTHRTAQETGREEAVEIEWEVEVISAVVEAVARETDEDVCE
jgi:thiol-disulfide isomerase/thioredoxin